MLAKVQLILPGPDGRILMEQMVNMFDTAPIRVEIPISCSHILIQGRKIRGVELTLIETRAE
jgi:hypothetical protein